MIKLRINSKHFLKFLQVYAPASAYDDESVEEFYENVGKVV